MGHQDLWNRLKAVAPLLVAAGLILGLGPSSEIAAAASSASIQSVQDGSSEQKHQVPDLPFAIFPSETIPEGEECEPSSERDTQRRSVGSTRPDGRTSAGLHFTSHLGTLVPFYCLLSVYRL